MHSVWGCWCPDTGVHRFIDVGRLKKPDKMEKQWNTCTRIGYAGNYEWDSSSSSSSPRFFALGLEGHLTVSSDLFRVFEMNVITYHLSVNWHCACEQTHWPLNILRISICRCPNYFQLPQFILCLFYCPIKLHHQNHFLSSWCHRLPIITN